MLTMMPIQRPLPPAGKPPIVPLPNPGVRPPRGGKPVQPPYGGKPPIKPLPTPRPDKPGTTGGPYIKPPPMGKMKKGGSVTSASKRADGVATKGKTRGKMC